MMGAAMASSTVNFSMMNDIRLLFRGQSTCFAAVLHEACGSRDREISKLSPE